MSGHRLAQEAVSTPTDRFTWERTVRNAPGVTSTQLFVLLTIATYMNADGQQARPSQKTLGEVTGLSTRTVRAHLTASVDGGWLIRVKRGHRKGDGTTVTSLYRASLPQAAAGCLLTSTGEGAPLENLNRQEGAPQPEADDISTGTPSPPTTSVNHDLTKGEAEDLAVQLLSKPTAEHKGEVRAIVALLAPRGRGQLTAFLAHHVAEGHRYAFPSDIRKALESDLPAPWHAARADNVANHVAATRQPNPFIEVNGYAVKRPT